MSTTTPRKTRLDVIRLGNVTIYKRPSGRWYGDFRIGNRLGICGEKFKLRPVPPTKHSA